MPRLYIAPAILLTALFAVFAAVASELGHVPFFHREIISFTATVGESNGLNRQHLYMYDLDRGIDMAVLRDMRMGAHAWSDDGQTLLMIMTYRGRRGVYLMDHDGDNMRLLIRTTRGDYPQWTHDRRSIQFFETEYWRIISPRTGREATIRISTDENRVRSTDGTWWTAVRRSERTGNTDVYMTRVDGTGAIQLTNEAEAVDSLPRWSPDGRFIAFERRFLMVVRDQGWYIMDVSDHLAGTFPDVKPLTHAMPLNRTQLTHMPWSAWSADSTRFLYIANDLYGAVNSPNLYMAYTDGSSVVQLTNTPDRHEWNPVWRP